MVPEWEISRPKARREGDDLVIKSRNKSLCRRGKPIDDKKDSMGKKDLDVKTRRVEGASLADMNPACVSERPCS